ncbi:MAG: hypothetical protein M3Q89_09215 [Verrucomicrobiota bacterium]|nr:hypothetical protein [Verrucomicrobiota bacterium]
MIGGTLGRRLFRVGLPTRIPFASDRRGSARHDGRFEKGRLGDRLRLKRQLEVSPPIRVFYFEVCALFWVALQAQVASPDPKIQQIIGAQQLSQKRYLNIWLWHDASSAGSCS